MRPAYCRFYRRHDEGGGRPSYSSVSDWGATAACLLYCCVFVAHGRRRRGRGQRMRPHVPRRGARMRKIGHRFNPTKTPRREAIAASGEGLMFGTPSLSGFLYHRQLGDLPFAPTNHRAPLSPSGEEHYTYFDSGDRKSDAKARPSCAEMYLLPNGRLLWNIAIQYDYIRF